MQRFEKYLRPLYSSLDKIVDYTDYTPQHKFPAEQASLEETVSKVYEHFVHLDARKDVLTNDIEEAAWIMDNETGDDKSSAVGHYNKLVAKMEKHIENMNHYLDIIDTPYFGKITFDRKSQGDFTARKIVTYIGKHAYFDKETLTPLITDWRAPIANLYYMNSGPREGVEFDSPAGVQRGGLTEKKQFEIARARIKSIYNSTSGNAAADEFLLSQLNSRIGQKLTDIVSTIQDQQNEIIRDEINRPILIQGVAGSGKTTILLHRLAYIFYTHKHLKPSDSLVLAPNSLFIDYISDVLPSLGVYGIQKNTYLFWAKKILGFDDHYILTTGDENLDIKKFKGSLDFQQLVDEYMEFYLRELFENMPGGGIAITIEERFKEMDGQEIELEEKLDLAIDYAFAQKKFKSRQAGGIPERFDADTLKRDRIKKYLHGKFDVYRIYKEMFTSHFQPEDIDTDTWKMIAKYSRQQLKGQKGNRKTYRMEDLAPLVWIHFKLHGVKQYLKDYIVVDEAQDLSTFNLLTLFSIAKSGNITIAGDLAQSIIPPFYIEDWESVMKSLSETKPTLPGFKYHQLFRCYRTTKEIINYANKIFEKYFPKSYKLPEAVLRPGEPVMEMVTSNRLVDGVDEDMQKLTEKLHKELNIPNTSTVALICKDTKHAEQVYKAISPYLVDLDIDVVDPDDKDYKSGLLIIPVERAKGLEFDSVIIADVDNTTYTEGIEDIRLIYVAITRALHRLTITHTRSDRSVALDATTNS